MHYETWFTQSISSAVQSWFLYGLQINSLAVKEKSTKPTLMCHFYLNNNDYKQAKNTINTGIDIGKVQSIFTIDVCVKQYGGFRNQFRNFAET